MKLKKKDLVKALRPGFETLGFHYFKDSILGSSGLFGKKVAKDLYFLAALNIHRFYDDAFTVDLCLTSALGCLYVDSGDIPQKCHLRPSRLLSSQERKLFLQEDDIDYWWSLYGETDIRPTFFDVLSIVEPRMTNDPILVREIRESVQLQFHALWEKWIIDIYYKRQFVENLSFSPDKPKDDIPLEWFKAAETLNLIFYKETFKNNVYFDASNAYHRFVLDSDI